MEAADTTKNSKAGLEVGCHKLVQNHGPGQAGLCATSIGCPAPKFLPVHTTAFTIGHNRPGSVEMQSKRVSRLRKVSKSTGKTMSIIGLRNARILSTLSVARN